MTTVNISLTSEQLKWVDVTGEKLGFANRSEFVRSLLRFVARRRELLDDVAVFPFVSPKTKSRKQIIKDFEGTKKYSKEFLKDLELGLKRSNYFEP